MSPDQWDDVVEEEIGEEEAPVEYHDQHDVTEAVWALWGQLDVLRQELEADRLGREQDGQAASAAMAEAIDALRGDLARRPIGSPDAAGASAGPAIPNALRSVSGDVERIHAALLADRAERQRYESALPGLLRKEMERALSQEAAVRAQGDDATQRALKGAFDVLRADLQVALREQAGGDGPALPKIVRAALDELKFQLAEERTQREARDASIAPSLQAVDDVLTVLHGDLEAERRERSASQQEAAQAVTALAAQLAQLRTDLERERAEGARREADLADLLADLREAARRADEAADIRHVAAESNQAAAASALHEAVQVELGEVTRALDGLRRTAMEAAQAAEADDARFAAAEAEQAAAVEAVLNAVRGELEALRESGDAAKAAEASAVAALREELAGVRATQAEQAAHDGALAAAVAGLQAELSQAREELFKDRQLRDELDAVGVAATETLQARLAELRELFLQEVVRDGSRDAVFGQLRDDLVQDMVQRDAAFGQLRDEILSEMAQRAAGANELRAVLAAQREAEERQVAQRQSWEAALGGALATLHDELLAQKEELASLKGLLAENRREQEALAFKLPEATQEMQQQVAQAESANVQTLKQLEELLRSTMSGANTWFVRTRDDLVERLDQMASTVDLGIAESMVAVLEQLRAEVAAVREEMAALGRRQHLTAAQVRKIMKEPAPDGAGGNGKGRTARPAKAARGRPS